METPKNPSRRRFKDYILTGIITLIPISVTWFVVAFLYRLVSSVARPLVEAFTVYISPSYPLLNNALHHPFLQTVIFIMLVLCGLYLLGLVTTQVVGQKLVALIDAVFQRIPFIEAIYNGTKKFVAVLKNKPANGLQRVVLINFPTDHMRAVGFVTRSMKDTHTGRELVAVYVPTTPNPTSGYMEIVPVEDVVPTDWTMDEAMTYIISGGTVAPDTVAFDKVALDKPKLS
jgi:uncharacterized membrane protein